MAIKPVIVGTNGSAASARAVAWAVQEAVRRDVPLRIVAVLPPGLHGGWLVPADPLYGALRETAVHALDEEASRSGRAAPGLTVDTSLVIDDPAPFLAGNVLSASILVVGARGAARPGTGQLGSVSRYLATHARSPVVIIPSATPAPKRQVVVGVRDPDDEAHLAFAFEEAASRSAHLLVVQAWQHLGPAGADHAVAPAHILAGALTRLSALVDPWRDKYPGVEVGEDVIHARPAQALTRLSAVADLLVLGRHDASLAGAGAPLSPLTQSVLSHARGPIVLVPADDRR